MFRSLLLLITVSSIRSSPFSLHFPFCMVDCFPLPLPTADKVNMKHIRLCSTHMCSSVILLAFYMYANSSQGFPGCISKRRREREKRKTCVVNSCENEKQKYIMFWFFPRVVFTGIAAGCRSCSHKSSAPRRWGSASRRCGA